MTNVLAQQRSKKQKATTNIIISGSISPDSDYKICNSNGEVITHGRSDNKGIITAIFTRQLGILYHQDSSILIPLEANGVFAFQKQVTPTKTGMVMLGGTGATVAKFVGKQLASGVIGSIGSMAFEKVLEATFGPDQTQQKLDKLLSGQEEIKGLLNDIQTELKSGFASIDKQFNRLFKHNLNIDVLHNKTRIESLNNALTAIDNTLDSEKYEQFWEECGDKYEVEGKSEEEVTSIYSVMWKDLADYGKSKGYTIDTIGSLEFLLSQIFNKTLINSDFEIENQMNFLELYIKDAEDVRNEKIIEDDFISNAVGGVNLITNLDTSHVGGEKPKMKEIHDGLLASVLYTGYLDFLTITNMIAELNFFMVNFGFINQYKGSSDLIEKYNKCIKGVTKTIKLKMGPYGWPGISWLESYYEGDFTGYSLTIIEAPMLQKSSSQAKNLAYEKSAASERSKCFTHVQQNFLKDIISRDQRYTQLRGYKAEYKMQGMLLATYYAASMPKKNNELFPV